MIRLETERLILTEWCVEDAEVLFELNSDTEVIKYTGDPGFKDVNEAKVLIDNYDQYKRYKMGRLAAIVKRTGKMIGWCGLKYDEEDDFVDLGFRFLQAEWNKGYATEASKAVLMHGFNELHLEKIIAHAMVENIASQRVMQKLGMSFIEEGMYKGVLVVQYQMIRSEYSDLSRV